MPITNILSTFNVTFAKVTNRFTFLNSIHKILIEMSSTLYPLKFEPILKERIWGGKRLETVLSKKLPDSDKKYGESWEVSGVAEENSIVRNGFLAGNTLNELVEVYMGDLVGEEIYERFGDEFPLLVKLIDASETLSIQVHPNDDVAEERHHAYGKTEMWYILDAEPNSKIYTGFKDTITKEDYLKALEDGKIDELLHVETPKKDDVFFIPAGRVHAIGKGVLLAEIQQTSDVTYRIFDWNRVDSQGKSRELHTNLAIDVVDFNKVEQPKFSVKAEINKTQELISCQYFTVNRIKFQNPLQRDYNLLDSFIIFLCLEGSCSIIYGSGKSEQIAKGETVLLPTELKDIILKPNGTCSLLETYIR
jgi:mannose-6-phosphate isomerase